MKTIHHRIFLTGFMGSGKTTIGEALANRLSCRMIDLDEYIAQREGRSIPAIIDSDGLDRFREIETSALMDLVGDHDARVIALGGGTWTIERNRSLLSDSRNIVVWLDAPFELCWKRIENAGDIRPLARNRITAQELYDERRSSYGLAHIRIICDGNSSIEDTADRIEQAILLKTN